MVARRGGLRSGAPSADRVCTDRKDWWRSPAPVRRIHFGRDQAQIRGDLLRVLRLACACNNGEMTSGASDTTFT